MRKKIVLGLAICFMLVAGKLFAADGDLIVNGNVGIGTTAPNFQGVNNVVALAVNGGSGKYGMLELARGGIVNAENELGVITFYRGTDRAVAIGAVKEGNGAGGYLVIATEATDGGFRERVRVTAAGNVGIGTTTPEYTLHVNGSFAAATKNFDIQDPRYNDSKKRLIHSTLEGPEVAVYYRGESQLINGKAVIKLPGYFEALTKKENRTVLLTPKFEKDDETVSSLAASAVVNGEFKTIAIDKVNMSQKFYWEVKAVRSDVKPLEVEVKK